MSSIIVLLLGDLFDPFFSSGKTQPVWMHSMRGSRKEVMRIKSLKCTENKRAKRTEMEWREVQASHPVRPMLEQVGVGLESCVIKDGPETGEAADEEYG